MALECIKGTTVPIVDVVKKARDAFLSRYDYSGWNGMCPAFCKVLINLNLSESVGPDDVPKFIPLFNEQVAEDKFGADTYNLFWWGKFDDTPRIEYFDWLIEQYSKEI